MQIKYTTNYGLQSALWHKTSYDLDKVGIYCIIAVLDCIRYRLYFLQCLVSHYEVYLCDKQMELHFCEQIILIKIQCQRAKSQAEKFRH